MKEVLFNLILFNHMSNVVHRFIGQDYLVLRRIILRPEDIEPRDILFQCPLEVYEKFQELERVIENNYPELRPAQLTCGDGEDEGL